MKIDPVLISMIRQQLPNTMAEEICSVQPMTGVFGDGLELPILGTMSEAELIEQGYEPISPDTRIMWRKK